MAKGLVMAQIQTKALAPEAMHKALQQTYASLMTLQAREETDGAGEGKHRPLWMEEEK
jgi:hypothetical protein